MRISVAVRDKVGKDFVRKEIRFVQQLTASDLARIARECEQTIKDIIMTKTRLPTGKLASYFYAENCSVGNTVAWGIGDIPELDREVPYWNHLDKGSQGIGANWQHFLPKGFWSNGRWIENPSGYAGIQPQSPIPAVNYIAETLARMESKLPHLLTGTEIRTILLRGR
ncbi:MAG: hypothetical protein PVG65_01030 [Candidatus Thorarchaeota archaeon]|jgi:hypothetical protein